MLNNHLYNLFSVTTEESRSLWRLKNVYKEDSSHCEECKKLCEELITTKEEQVEKLKELVKKHL